MTTIKVFECKNQIVKYSTNEVLAESKAYLEVARTQPQYVYHYYAVAERGDKDAKEKDVLLVQQDDRSYFATTSKDASQFASSKKILWRGSYDDVITNIEAKDVTDPEAHKELLLKALNGEDPTVIREYYPEAVYVVTRSFQPEDKRPWKRIGRRSYLWLATLEERDKDKGRRIEWGGDCLLYASRKEALKEMYKD